MKLTHYINTRTCIAAMFAAALLTACKKDGNPNNLPSVSPEAYAGKIEGYQSSDEIYPNNVVAYWSFDDTKNETKSNTAPTQTLNDAIVADGVRGKAIEFTKGFLYYKTQFQKFKTDSLKNWSISVWVKLKNNGSKRTMVLQLARPANFNGSINVALNTNAFPAGNDSMLTLQPTFLTIGGGTQDNLNSVLNKVNLNNWVHIVLTYDFATGVFNNWINGMKVGNFPNRGVGNNNFKAYEPSELLIGANYNAAGMSVSADVAFEAMTGRMDELRFYNIALPDAHIKALYKLGVAKQ